MRKSLIFVGMLAISFANAQQGNVGVNTTTPNATLELNVADINKSNNTNQGILAPRLTKTRIANIASPVQGTLVYVLDEDTTENPSSLISAYTGSDIKVAKITEKGYYFYNGAEWVKVQNSNDTQNLPWIYNTDGNVELNHTNANYKAIYTDKKYSFKNFDGQYEYYAAGTDNGRTIVTDDIVGNAVSSSLVKTSKIENDTNVPTARNSVFALGIDADAPDNLKTLEGINANVFTEAKNTKDYTYLRGANNMASHNGTGTVNTLSGSVGISSTFPTAKTTNQYGLNSQASQYSDYESTKVVGARGYASQRGAGTIANLIGVDAEADARVATSTGNITNAVGVLANLNFNTNRYTGSIENMAGVKITQTVATGALASRITNNYGLYIGDVLRGSNPYSIYTEAGKIRFGNLAGTGTRLVAVDENGILTTTAGSTDLSSKWTNDSANTLVKLTNLSNGTTARTDARNLFITDTGNVGIGTPSPEVSLHIKKGAAHIQIERNSENRNGAGIIALKSRGTTDAPTAIKNADHLFSIVSGGHNGTEMVKSKAGFYMTASEDWTATANGTFMTFNTTNNGTTDMTEKMRITNDGNIGINTTNPQLKVAIVNNYTGLDFIDNEGLFLVSKGTSLLNTGIRSIGSVEISADTNANYSPSTNRFEGIQFKTFNEERMRITETGNVGIGTESPSQKLEVSGAIKVSTTDSTCSSAILGTIKFENDNFYGCKSTGWVQLNN